MGGLQVDEHANLANWAVPGKPLLGVGGAMDLAFGAAKLLIVMTHTTKDNQPKILKECTYALTAPRRVNTVVTDIAVIDVTDKGLVLRETAPGWTVSVTPGATSTVVST